MNDTKEVATTTAYQKAIDKWGKPAQISVACEEFGELISALMRYRTGKGDAMDVLREMADAQIMLDQMKYIFGRESFEIEHSKKFDRLIGMVME